MKKMKINIVFALALAFGLTSCLKKDAMNIDPDQKSAPFVQLVYNHGTSAIGSGLQYFGNGSLLFSSSDPDTVTFFVGLGGPIVNKDVTLKIGVDNNSLQDNQSNDGLTYVAMPTDDYKILNNTVTIKAGKNQAPVQIVFYPDKIDPTQNYGLPIGVNDPSGYVVSRNFGKLYLHTIGNPIAGTYNWDFYRYNNQDGSGTPAGGTFTGGTVTFAPVSPTAIKVPTGYYVQPDYLITFDNNNGVLSNFKAVIAPDEIKAAFTDNGITVVAGPTITVSSDYRTFTIKYTVFNGSAYRNLTDIYYK